MEIEIFYLINQGMANPFFDVLMPALTHQGYLVGIPLVLYTLYASARTMMPDGRSFLPIALSAVLIAVLAPPAADALVDQIKVLIGRPRPCQALEDARLLITCPRSFSFPSSHAATSFAFATPLFLMTKPFLTMAWRITPLLFAAAIAFSRPYLGVHYPSDVIAGLLLGSGLATVPCLLLLRSAGRPVRRKAS